ncbi:MAG: hypothetical protein HGA75_00480 [Thiobacillus sp.]|nr:hypothetical protein [Thiobacillus sp.]
MLSANIPGWSFGRLISALAITVVSSCFALPAALACTSSSCGTVSHSGCGGNDNEPTCGEPITTAFYTYDADILKQGDTESFSIRYSLVDDWSLDSAYLWVLARDDTLSTIDSTRRSSILSDPSETAKIVNIEGQPVTMNAVEINGLDWYFGFDVKSFIGGVYTSPLTGVLKDVTGDFVFLGAKLALTQTKPCPPPPSEVPLPGAAWLFGSALFGFVAWSNRRRV